MKSLGLFVSLLACGPGLAHAAACCGGGSNFPALILGDERAQLGFNSSVAGVVGDAPSQGKAIFRSGHDNEYVQTYALDGAFLISDRWQLGAQLPVVRRQRSVGTSSASASGLGDVSTTLGFEALPEYTYSRWRPRIFLFVQGIFPTGGNIYEARQAYAVDARGRGFFALATGAFFVKGWRLWDLSLRLQLTQPFARSFESSDGSVVRAAPGLGLSTAIGVGLSPGAGAWRIGLSLNPVWEGSSNLAARKLVWNLSADLSRIFDERWAASLAYADQTLFGPAHNVSLSRMVALALKYKWDR